MRRRKLLYGLGASGAVLVPSGLTAAAYNSFTVDREANINVRADDSGNSLLGLIPGGSDLVTTNSDGALTIDVSEATTNADGVNVDSTLVIGDTSGLTDSTTTAAFMIVNNDDEDRDYDVSYTEDTADSAGSTNNVKFRFYDSSGSELSVSPASENSTKTISLAAKSSSGDTVYVTVEVDTNNLTASSDDLTGTLTFSSSP